MDKLKTMRTFVEVARNKSFGVASERLGISVSLVSKHVSELESTLGVRLLSRTTRHIEITEIGQRYLDSCVAVLRDIESVEDSIKDMQRTLGGSITVRASHSMAVLYISRLIAEFSLRYPSVTINMVVDEDPPHAVLEAQRGLDVAFHVGRVQSDLLARRVLAGLPMGIYASEAYLRVHGTPATPPDLQHHNCLVHPTASPGGTWDFGEAPDVTKISVSGTITSNSFITLRQAALDGVGLAMLPAFCVAPYRERPALVRVLADHGLPPRELQLLMSPDRRRPRRIRTFVDFAVKWFDPVPWSEDTIG